MIDPSLEIKEFVSCLVGLVSLGIDKGRLDDAEALLACVRALRPKVTEFDTFEAWIAMRRGFWDDAMRILRNLDATSTTWSTAKAFLAYCQFMTGDATWQATANEVLENSNSPEAVEIVKALLNPEQAVATDVQAPAASAEPDAAANYSFMRA